MYLALASRPDISYAVNRLAQFTSNPKGVHWTAVKRIFRYLKYMKNANLTCGGNDAEIKNTELNFLSVMPIGDMVRIGNPLVDM